MIYTPEQIESIEKVKRVFKDYLDQFPDLDLIYSPKAGYVLLYSIKHYEEIIDCSPIFIRDGRSLCDFFLYELACNVMTKLEQFHDIHEASPQERDMIEQAFELYLRHLPEYRDLIDHQFRNPFENHNQDAMY